MAARYLSIRLCTRRRRAEATALNMTVGLRENRSYSTKSFRVHSGHAGNREAPVPFFRHERGWSRHLVQSGRWSVIFDPRENKIATPSNLSSGCETYQERDYDCSCGTVGDERSKVPWFSRTAIARVPTWSGRRIFLKANVACSARSGADFTT